MTRHGLVAEKTALITGAGSGIGKATALALAQEGARIAALDKNAEWVQRTVREIEDAGGEAMALVADVSQADQMERAVAQAGERFGRIDIVFANAGINGVWAPLEELTPEDWDLTLNTNLKGTFLTVKYALPYLKREGGSVIVTSSINGARIFSNTGATAYSCSKAGQVAFAKMIALELAKHRIRVNVICPGAIDTNINQPAAQRDREREKEPVALPRDVFPPLTDGRPGQPEQVAQLALFLASDAASHISGTEVYIDGASSLLKG